MVNASSMEALLHRRNELVQSCLVLSHISKNLLVFYAAAVDMKAAMNMIAEEEDDEVPGEPFFVLFCLSKRKGWPKCQMFCITQKIKTNVTV